ncbi:TetR/AcrR family transcriptional regulator [Hoeflea sp. AS16]|uniref:TetR/AcrR family transcriptional regulator n=1 Tax=Hoeflea sp. AS16 TaxID=3135779 RepID=UPI00316F422F
MPPAAPRSLAPRKRPRQARATVTLDAVFEATIQVLLTVGPHRLTTTRVAERAGVSVGTMYQYFAHKQALIYALNERYLDALADKIEVTCLEQRGMPARQMIEALIECYWRAKTERADVTQALYRSVAELDNEALIDAFAARADAATKAMLASAPDLDTQELESMTRTLLTVIFGSVRNAFERNLDEVAARQLRGHLAVMCGALLDSRSGPPA